MPNTGSIQAATHTPRSAARRSPLLAVAATPVATLAVWAVAQSVADLNVRVGANSASHVGPLTVLIVSLMVGVAAWATRLSLERSNAQRAGRAWVKLALIVLVVSLAGPLSAGTNATTKLALACMHLAAAAVLIPALARPLALTSRREGRA
jgi:hypothetical protein